MRRVFSLVFAVCMALLLTVPAFADGRGPAFTSYDVVCSRETPYYRENWDDGSGELEKIGSFPAGTSLTVEYEYERDGDVYGNVEIDFGEGDEWVYVRLSDVELKDDEYLPENAQKLKRAHTVRVIEKGGVPMYAGPNKKYARIMTIPRGTKLTYTYGNDNDDYYRTWAYVTFFGRSGWIYVHASDTKNGLAELPDEGSDAEIWVLADGVKMYDGISFGNIEAEITESWDEDARAKWHEEPDREIGTLEKGEKYTYRYYHEQTYGTWFYVTAGLRSGWVFQSHDNDRVAETADRYQKRFMAYKAGKLKLRETPDKNAAGTTVSIAAGTVPNPQYIAYAEYAMYYYETIGGQSGWYSYEDIADFSAYNVEEDNEEYGYYRKNKGESPAPIYKDIVTKSKTVGSIPVGSVFTPLYYGSREIRLDEENSEWMYFYYVRYNDVTGWVDESDLYTPVEEEETTAAEEEPDDTDVWEDGEDWVDDAWGEEDDLDDDTFYAPDYAPVSQRGLSPLQIVLICVGGAVVLALTAVVTLTLIRRKRKARVPVPTEEAPEETQEETDAPDEPDAP